MPLPPLVEPVARLSDAERARTLRHAVLAGFGDEAQRRLAAAHVAIVGAGGLGSPAVLALAAAGVGTLTIIDDDVIETTNLQRQVIHRSRDIGVRKVDSVVRVAADLSPDTTVRTVTDHLDERNAAEVLSGADVVLDGTDSFATRAVVAAACERLGVPLVWGVVQEFHAQVTVFWSQPPAGHPPVVLADLYPPDTVGELPTCAAAGVLGTLTMQVGTVMANEAIKLIAGVGDPLLGRVMIIDSLAARTHEVPLRPSSDPNAPNLLSTTPEDTMTDTPDTPAAPAPIAQLTAQEMLDAQDAGATLLDVREPFETAQGIVAGSTLIPMAELFADPGAAGPGPVVIICAHGVRAQHAAEVLRTRGVEASVLSGGLAAWAQG